MQNLDWSLQTKFSSISQSYFLTEQQQQKKNKKKNSSASCFIYNFVFQVISEKHCVAKILLAI